MQYSAAHTIERKELLQNRCFYTLQCNSILLIVVKSCMNNKTSIRTRDLSTNYLYKKIHFNPIKDFFTALLCCISSFFPVTCSFPEVTHTHNNKVAYCIVLEREMQPSVTSLWSWISIDTFHKKENLNKVLTTYRCTAELQNTKGKSILAVCSIK